MTATGRRSSWPADDFQQLWQAITAREIYVLSDEVYEHICFAPGGHQSVLAHDGLRQRAIAVSSFGKTYHMTGWKVGYCVAPPALSAEVRKIHQYLTFAVNTPAQLALADMLRQEPAHWQTLPAFYRQRRDHLVQALAPSRLKLLPCEGTYFLLADYSAVSDKDDVAFCQWLTTPAGAVNRFLLVQPDGVTFRYDKRHLFRMADEHRHYQAGQERVVVDWRGWRILPQVCYDLHFPLWSRNQQDYDLALYVANWPAPGAAHWQTLLAARAIENQAYVAGCNRVGSDGNQHHYSGNSLIIDPQGAVLAQAAAACLQARLSLATLRQYREAFPAWRDADRFSLKP